MPIGTRTMENIVIEAAKTETAQRIAGKSVLVVEKAVDELLADKPNEKK